MSVCKTNTPKLSTPTQNGPHAHTAKKLYPFLRPILLHVQELLCF